MDVQAIADSLSATAAAIATVRGASSQPVDTIPATPYAVVGAVENGTVIPGSWERTRMRFPLWVYWARTQDAARVQKGLNPFVNSVIAAYRSNGTQGGTIASALVTEWTTNKYDTVGAEEYQVCEFWIEVVVNSAVGYAP